MPSVFSRLFGASAAPQTAQKSTMFGDAFYANSFVHTPGKPVWMRRDYGRFAQEAYARNVIAHRSIDMVARAVASVPLCLFLQGQKVVQHPVLNILAHPNPMLHGTHLIESLMAYQLISGNAFVHAVGPMGESPLELHVLRPDRVAVIAGEGGVPRGYQYKVGEKVIMMGVDRISGQSRVLHLKQFHPLDDWYGLSPVEAAAYSIDQHNQSGAWNQALMQNGARPSGALVVNMKDQGGRLSAEQYDRIKQQVDDQFSGPANAGRPLLLEGGLDWKEMSLSPKDMDFIEAKHSAARDIALAFGVPPQLLGIPGDNSFSNLAEARLALWEQTIIPAVNDLVDALNHWLLPMFENDLRLQADLDDVPALSLQREQVWNRINNASFLSDDEKRALVGL